jgi:antitoxin (DNA-binding transcriptional repressor) of toxin-antitoxin stability system
MQFVAHTDLRSPKVWSRVQKEKAVITNHGKPVALVIPINEGNFEETLARVNQMEGLQALRDLQAQAKTAGTDRMTLDEINLGIAAARKARRARRS